MSQKSCGLDGLHCDLSCGSSQQTQWSHDHWFRAAKSLRPFQPDVLMVARCLAVDIDLCRVDVHCLLAGVFPLRLGRVLDDTLDEADGRTIRWSLSVRIDDWVSTALSPAMLASSGPSEREAQGGVGVGLTAADDEKSQAPVGNAEHERLALCEGRCRLQSQFSCISGRLNPGRSVAFRSPVFGFLFFLLTHRAAYDETCMPRAFGLKPMQRSKYKKGNIGNAHGISERVLTSR